METLRILYIYKERFYPYKRGKEKKKKDVERQKGAETKFSFLEENMFIQTHR